MSEPEAVGEGSVSGNQASIPAAIRNLADIEDGDKLRWYWVDGELSVDVVRRRDGVFEGFEGFDGGAEPLDHDLAGVEPAGDRDVGGTDA
jgi:hypothetical protein